MNSTSRSVLAVLALLFVVAGGMRLADLDAPGTLIEREYRSMLLARSMYYTVDPPAESWKRETARVSALREGRLEPPINEALVAAAYVAGGRERVWVSRVLGTGFWLAGGLFLFALARRLADPAVAVVPLGFYLLAPVAVTTSRSFQPDSLMIFLTLVGLHAMIRHAERPTRARYAWAIASAAAAILVKPFVVFLIPFAFAALTIHRKGLRGLFRVEAIAFAALAVTPTIAWFAWNAFGGVEYDIGVRFASHEQTPDSMIGKQMSISMFPAHLLQPGFYVTWAKLALMMVGTVSLPVGLLGGVWIRRTAVGAVVLGAWASYPLFGLVSSNLIADHGYYHLQLIPLVALGLAPVGRRLWEASGGNRVAITIGLAVALGWTASAASDVRAQLGRARFEPPQRCRKIGELVGHTTRAVYIARHYGRPLEYYGELSGSMWPKRVPDRAPDGTAPMSVEERMALFTFEPEVFILSDLRRFATYHDDLRRWLEANCRMLADEETYKIWDACVSP